MFTAAVKEWRMNQIVLTLPPELHDALQHLAGRDENALAGIVHDALRNDLRRRVHARSARIATQLQPIRAQLETQFSDALNWRDLADRLTQSGYQLMRRGGGLSLESLDGQRLCSVADLGHSHAQLTRRFGRSCPATMANVPLAS